MVKLAAEVAGVAAVVAGVFLWLGVAAALVVAGLVTVIAVEVHG